MYRRKANSAAKAVAVGLALLLTTGTLTACTGGINSPVNTSYMTINPIEIEEISVYRNGEPREEEPPAFYEYDRMTEEEQQYWADKEVDFSGNYLEITGLKDKAVQDKINQRIKQLYLDNIAFVPPYRGIKALIGEEPQRMENEYSAANMYVQGNFNNMLSIMLNCHTPYKALGPATGQGSYISVTWSVPLNIDLNTGEEISIAELFCDDVDGIAYLNNYFSELLTANYGEEQDWQGEEEYVLTGPFKTFKDSQKYALSSYGISLILDYDTPEVYSDYYYQILAVPYSSDMAVFKRFMGEGNIYTSDAPREKNLLIPEVKNDKELEKTNTADGIEVSKTVRYSAGLPEPVKDRIKELYQSSPSDAIERVRPYYERAVQKDGTNARGEIWYTTTVDRTGDFIILFIREFEYVTGETEQYYIQENYWYETYDVAAEKSDSMQLADLVVEGVDAETFIKQGMLDSIRQAEEDYEDLSIEGLSEQERKQKAAQLVDILYESINGFAIQSASLTLSFDKSDEEIAELHKELYGKEDYSRVYAARMLQYKNLNCDQMTIFR